MEGARPYTDLDPVPHSVSWEAGRAESPMGVGDNAVLYDCGVVTVTGRPRA
jgi:hypothetical protein